RGALPPPQAVVNSRTVAPASTGRRRNMGTLSQTKDDDASFSGPRSRSAAPGQTRHGVAAISARRSSSSSAPSPSAVITISSPQRTPSASTASMLVAGTLAPLGRAMRTSPSNSEAAVTNRAAGRACSPTGEATVTRRSARLTLDLPEQSGAAPDPAKPTAASPPVPDAPRRDGRGPAPAADASS